MSSHNLANRAAATNMLSQTISFASLLLYNTGAWVTGTACPQHLVKSVNGSNPVQSVAHTAMILLPVVRCHHHTPPPRTRAGGPAATEVPTPQHGFMRYATISTTMSTTHP